ncbi:RPC2 [Hepatospora eriocheir]|uniref:DNA-directed RNA polymerase n=1 Tax=Hepatospora eriocheir TaxID=1081669 RepID=A0A1X0QE14_9MICR|nr:RPC2 [Hepatospora eriocheir]
MCRPLFIIDQEKLKKINFELLERKDNFIDNFAKRNRERNFKVIEQLGLLFTEKSLKGMTFNDLLKRGKVEYLDVKESNNCKIAFTLDDITCDTTHLEISEISILGNIVASVPFPDHNQSPRNTYQCAMGKQAIGHIATNVKKRFDNAILQLNYTQRPLAASKILDINKYNSIPSGLNAMVAVMSYSGYDIEDAIILNQGSVDRGFARVEVYKTIKIELKKFSNGANETIYSSAKSSGLVEVGQLVKQGDPLVVKISPEDKNIITIRHKGKPCYIDKVLLSKSEDENMIKIVTRETRVPVVGDKFSSRHGQKGVVGAKFPLSDMPFNEQGMVPDIIMNPHGFPSRMTVGKILELIGGKAGAIVGEYADATPFNDNEVEDFCNVLTKNGFSYSGKDIFTSGTTGEQYEAYIFYGPIFYQRLKHMVADKIHCRSRGPRAVLTRQPTEGRSNDGGLRLGEMERDCLIGYGAGSLLKERLMFASDVYKIFVCKKCGIIGYKNCCTICNANEISPIEIPYAAKLLFQELMAMNVLPKKILKDK